MADTSWRKQGTRHVGRSGQVSDRRFERVALAGALVEVYPEGTLLLKLTFRGAPNIGLELLDVSESGVRVALCKSVSPEATVRLVGRIPHFGETIEGTAKVVWCADSGKTDGRHFAGLDFLSVPNGHYDKIQRLRKAVFSPEYRQLLTMKKAEEASAAAEAAKRPEDGQDGLVIMPPPNT